MSDDAKAKLLSVLQARGLQLGLDDVSWAFESGSTKTDAVAWVEEYLNDATLLTKDELAFYDAIGDSAKLELSTASHAVVPLQDRDIREAIAALKSSTSAIENHARALQAQREVLSELSGKGARANGTSSLSTKYGQESSSLNFAIEDLTFSIAEQLKEAEEYTSKSLNGVRSFTTERLAADEQVLEALTNLSSKAVPAKESSVNHSDLEKWFQTLATLRASEVAARIDAMLAAAGPISGEKLGDEGSELYTELQTLKEEIDSVVQMVIGHELRNPLLKSVEGSESSKRQNQQGWSKYLLSTLEYLIAQLDTATTRIVDLRGYADALLELRALLTETNTETKDHETNGEVKTSRPTERIQRKRSASQAASTSSITQALRRLNIKMSAATPTSEILSQLDSLASSSTAKLHTQYAGTEKAIIDNLGKSLGPKQQDALAVSKQLYAASEFSSISLSDRGLDGKARELGKKIDELAPKVAGADMR